MSGDAGVFPWNYNFWITVCMPVYVSCTGTGEGFPVYRPSQEGFPSDSAGSHFPKVYGRDGYLQGGAGSGYHFCGDYRNFIYIYDEKGVTQHGRK